MTATAVAVGVFVFPGVLDATLVGEAPLVGVRVGVLGTAVDVRVRDGVRDGPAVGVREAPLVGVRVIVLVGEATLVGDAPLVGVLVLAGAVLVFVGTFVIALVGDAPGRGVLVGLVVQVPPISKCPQATVLT